ncbi:FAD binding domain protein [Aspergillus ellipticus CBS 707.79]|uniref:FAD binding domain protein n=1 Tax=Aspergillus ellipticus CBS 707.79 TaxID=1448320 RepID=A0A319DP47_9EURO|nr:FAD binding domain protein [Aspergillus ellipticus CBS 707.79]
MHLPSILSWLLSWLWMAQEAVDLRALYGPGLSPGARIALSSDANYTHVATQRWTVHGAPQYLGAILPATEHDIQHIIHVSRAHDIDFLVVGAGHGATVTYEQLRHGIAIDLQHFKHVQLDADASRLTVGGGTVFSDLIEPLQAARQEMVTPSAPCVGVVGMTLGGGIGSLQGLHGLLLDSLDSVRLVTADGDLIEVSATQHPDLFWGLRGAGSNFGVVTAATYRTHEATHKGFVTNTDFIFPASSHAAIWQALSAFDEALPAELALTLAVAYNRTIDQQPLMLVNAIYYGPEAHAQELLGPFTTLASLATRTVTVPWNALLNTTFFGLAAQEGGACTKNQGVNIYSIGLNRTEVPAFETYMEQLLQFYRQHPTYDGRFLVQRYPTQAVLATPDGETAYPHREIKMHINLEGWYTDPALEDPVNAFMRQSRRHFQQASGFDHAAVYVNYAHGDEGADVWYTPSKLDNLTRLKQDWDPEGRFSWSNPVPLEDGVEL